MCVSITYRFTYQVQNADNQAPSQTNWDQDLLQRVFIRIVFNELSEESVVYQDNETTVRILNEALIFRYPRFNSFSITFISGILEQATYPLFDLYLFIWKWESRSEDHTGLRHRAQCRSIVSAAQGYFEILTRVFLLPINFAHSTVLSFCAIQGMSYAREKWCCYS